MFVTVPDHTVGIAGRTGPDAPAGTRSSDTAGPGTRPAVARGARIWRRLPPYLYLAPAIAFLAVFSYSPLVQSFVLSVFDWNMLPTTPQTFVGLDNYVQAVTLPEVHQAVGNTVVYILALAGFSLVLPLVIALASQQVRGRWKTLYQAIIFVPYLLTPVATSAVWRWLFDANDGAITTVLRGAGIDAGNVFRDPALAIVAIIIAAGWQLLGFGVLVISAGIAGISPDYGHAAALDGAGGWRITRRITLPLLSPTLLFLGLMTILLAAPWTFSLIDIITQGGPAGSTTNIYYALYQFGFLSFDTGLSSALGVLFFLVFGAIALTFVELTERFSFYDN